MIGASNKKEMGHYKTYQRRQQSPDRPHQYRLPEERQAGGGAHRRIRCALYYLYPSYRLRCGCGGAYAKGQGGYGVADQDRPLSGGAEAEQEPTGGDEPNQSPTVSQAFCTQWLAYYKGGHQLRLHHGQYRRLGDRIGSAYLCTDK